MKFTLHKSCQMASYQDIVRWCDERIVRLKKKESIASLIRINELQRVRRVLKRRVVKLKQELGV